MAYGEMSGMYPVLASFRVGAAAAAGPAAEPVRNPVASAVAHRPRRTGVGRVLPRPFRVGRADGMCALHAQEWSAMLVVTGRLRKVSDGGRLDRVSRHRRRRAG